MPRRYRFVVNAAAFALGLLVSLLLYAMLADGAEPLPPINIPPEMRHENYGDGSCLWAAIEDCLAWQGLGDEAAWWRAHCSGGAVIGPSTKHQFAVEVAVNRGLRFAYTDRGEESFLQWCSDSRRAAAIQWIGRGTVTAGRGRRQTQIPVDMPGTHAVTFCGFAGDQAFFIDNNDPARVYSRARADFLRIWRASGGAAFTVVYQVRPLPAETSVPAG